jgi:two-component system, OmpR family, sensor kinase
VNVRAKLLISQSLNVMLVVGVAIVAVIVAQRFDYEVKRAELAYDQRQTITQLAVQAFHYKTAIGDGRAGSAELALARRDVRATLNQFADQVRQELALVSAEDQMIEAEEGERIGQLQATFDGVDALVDRIISLEQGAPNDGAGQLRKAVEQRFAGEIAEALARAMADEESEVIEADASIAELAVRRVAFLIIAGVGALAISVATGWFLNRSISRPIGQLLGGVHALQAGDLKHRVPWKGGDEFAQLASQFNDMAAAVEDRQRRLLDAQTDLERQVAARTAELETLNRRLTYLDRQRLLFLADVSHELRTPVTIMRGEAEVTLRSQARHADEYRETLRRVALQAEQMGRLIDDLLFLVRSESDSISFDRQPVDLRAVVADAVDEGNTLARSKGVAVRQNLPVEPIRANADSQRLRQAILIAIDNAIKYSETDSAIEVSLTRRSGHAAITVLDHGIGIPADELPYVFERFYRIRSGDRRPDGSGLGLPIAKWIAEKHDGTIAMSSTPGRWTELTIELATLERDMP